MGTIFLVTTFVYTTTYNRMSSVLFIFFRYSVRTNLILDSVEDAVAELKSFKAAGGATLCDVSPIGIRCFH